MKKLIILILVLIPLFTYSQNVPVLETKIVGNYSLTDHQLQQNKELEDLLNEYYEGYYNEKSNPPSDVEKRVRTLMKSTGYEEEGLYEWSTEIIGCSWYCGAHYYTEASSSLPSDGKNVYDKSSCSDDDVRTAWVEGKDGYGIGEYIEFLFPKGAPQITDCFIINGYNKDEKTWKNNSRVKAMDIYVEDKLIATVNLKDTRDEQHFAFPDTIPFYKTTTKRIINGETMEGSVIKFVITDVYKGDIYDDTAISEISFDGIGVHCLAEGTLISTRNFTTKRIEDIEVGEPVIIYNSSKKIFAERKVKAIHKATHKTMYRISFQNSDIQLTITDDHPLWNGSEWLSIDPRRTANYSRYKGQKINVLKVGSQIMQVDGMAQVSKIEKIEYSKPSYTLELESNYPFIANGILVGQE